MDAIADAVVIGAGPAGLFQVFQLGLQGIHAHLIDALPHLGGQCVELYGDKPIYDIPGLPYCTGRSLVAQLEQQITPFQPTLHLGRRVETLARTANGFAVGLDSGTPLQAGAVFIAAGVGAFVPRALKLEGIEAHQGRQLHYHPRVTPALAAGQNVVVHGGDDAAVATALACVDAGAASITLLHRRDAFQAEPDQLAALQAARDAGRIQVIAAQITGQETQDGQLVALQLLTPEGAAQRLPLDQLIVCLGISPRLGPIADWGLALDKKQLVVNPATFETSEAGIYAVGDINAYPGKRRLILCAFHEATLAAFAAAERLAGAPVPLQYTTTSKLLHERLGLT